MLPRCGSFVGVVAPSVEYRQAPSSTSAKREPENVLVDAPVSSEGGWKASLEQGRTVGMTLKKRRLRLLHILSRGWFEMISVVSIMRNFANAG